MRGWRSRRSKEGWIEGARRGAALKAVGHIKDGSVVGLGSGSTVVHAVEALGNRIQAEGLEVSCIPTSLQIQMLASEHRIPIATPYEHPTIDLAIDGADQIDRGQLNLIKGGGGALTLEKIVDTMARDVVIIADETKLTDRLGEGQPLPIEVLPFALPFVLRRVEGLGGSGKVRKGSGKVGPVITDNGNVIVDADFGFIDDPLGLEVKLNLIPGVVENGLFLRMATLAYVGTRSGVITIKSQKHKEAQSY
ncbi:MAG: ribose 5-phosphate isomerase A [Candidatus Bathyarchaeia archaeon]